MICSINHRLYTCPIIFDSLNVSSQALSVSSECNRNRIEWLFCMLITIKRRIKPLNDRRVGLSVMRTALLADRPLSCPICDTTLEERETGGIVRRQRHL